MRISFDIDDTLVCGPQVPAEHCVPWWGRWWFPEHLRHGARRLMRDLHHMGHHLWIYTTSYRGPVYLRSWFWSIGVPLEGIVNQLRHERLIRRSMFRGYPPSKYPSAFGIDLHIDDSEGVAMEGREYGFRVLVVSPDDLNWTEHVLAAVLGHPATPP
jgi:hypothetical protein